MASIELPGLEKTRSQRNETPFALVVSQKKNGVQFKASARNWIAFAFQKKTALALESNSRC